MRAYLYMGFSVGKWSLLWFRVQKGLGAISAKLTELKIHQSAGPIYYRTYGKAKYSYFFNYLYRSYLELANRVYVAKNML